MAYTPEQVPLSQELPDVVAYLHRELSRISQAFSEDTLQVNKIYTEPKKPREGLLALADGASWNPGSGAGLYVYFTGVWKKVTLV